MPQKWEFSEKNMYIGVIQLTLLIFVRLSTKSDTKGVRRKESTLAKGQEASDKNYHFYSVRMLVGFL